jgi:hypothetical protein
LELTLVIANGRFDQDVVEFVHYKWTTVNNEPQTMKIDWMLPGGSQPSLKQIDVSYREYITDQSDTTTIFITSIDGRVQKIQSPAYAACDTATLLKTVESLILDTQPSVEGWVRNRYSSDPLKLMTFQEAVRYRDTHKSGIISIALRMQCGAILSQGYGCVTDPCWLEYVDFESYGKSEYEAYNRGLERPLPQAINHQVDVAILKCINGWQRILLKELKTKIFVESGSKSWYEVFLACFVLLSNLEYIHFGANAYIKSKLHTVSPQHCHVNVY